MTLRTRRATTEDIVQIVAVHLASFPTFFLSSLGPRFLRQFYLGLLDHHAGILVIATHNDRVVGVVGGSTNQVGFYSDLMRTRRWRFGRAALPTLLRRPHVALRVLRGRRRAAGDEATPDGACLMTIGVLPETQGTGAGRELVSAFEVAVREAGEDRYCLTTDAEDNDRTNGFYVRLGMSCERTITTPEGRKLNEYWKTLDTITEGER